MKAILNGPFWNFLTRSKLYHTTKITVIFVISHFDIVWYYKNPIPLTCIYVWPYYQKLIMYSSKLQKKIGIILHLCKTSIWMVSLSIFILQCIWILVNFKLNYWLVVTIYGNLQQFNNLSDPSCTCRTFFVDRSWIGEEWS